MDYQIAIEAGLDQIDACLRECAMTIHEISLKPPSEWNNEDWRIVIFSLHATAARAIYLQGEFLNGELEA